MTEFVVGFLLGAFAATSWHTQPVVLGLLFGLAAYFLSCAIHPYRACPRCGGNLKRGDGLGNYRIKGCAWCDGGRYVRFGARLIGRGD